MEPQEILLSIPMRCQAASQALSYRREEVSISYVHGAARGHKATARATNKKLIQLTIGNEQKF